MARVGIPSQASSRIDAMSDEELSSLVTGCLSWNALRQALGYKMSGSIFPFIKAKILTRGIDVSHFSCGSGWAKGRTKFDHAGIARAAAANSEISWDEMFCRHKSLHFSNSCLLKRLLSAGKKQYACEVCDVSKWQSKPLRLHLDHINGDNTDCREENLRVLCPNCHTQTDTYCLGTKKRKMTNATWWHRLSLGSEYVPPIVAKKEPQKRKHLYSCAECHTSLSRNPKSGLCRHCCKKTSRRTTRPSLEVLQHDIEELGWSGTGRKYGVSDNAIRNWVAIYRKCL
jgi:hypothetical protein